MVTQTLSSVKGGERRLRGKKKKPFRFVWVSGRQEGAGLGFRPTPPTSPRSFPSPGGVCERRSSLACRHCWVPPRVTVRIVHAGKRGGEAVRGASRCLQPGSCGDAPHRLGRVGK